MTTVTVSDGQMIFEVEGWDKLWALKSRLVIPVEHVTKVSADPTIAQSWWKGLKIAGAYVPGVIAAGTFYHHGNWVFWDVHKPENAIVVDLRDERYEKLIVGVREPANTVAILQAALAKP